MIGGDQGQVEKSGQVAAEEIEAEEKHSAMRLTGIRVGPEPRSLGALPHLGEIGRRVVGDEEEAGEVMTGRRPQIRKRIWNQRERGDGKRHPSCEARPGSRPALWLGLG